MNLTTYVENDQQNALNYIHLFISSDGPYMFRQYLCHFQGAAKFILSYVNVNLVSKQLVSYLSLRLSNSEET
jgi:hypothetical protein